MSKPTAKAGFSKVWKLIAVLKKCNGKAVIGSSSALISPKAAKAMAAAGLVLLTGLLGAAAFIAEPYLMKYFPLQSYTQTLLVAVLLISFVLSVKNIVTVLYTADDISVLLPLPFSVGQIVTAKLTVSLQFPVILSLILVNSTCLGFGISADAGAAFYIGTVLSSVFVPLTGMAVATLLVVIVFRVFGFVRNRDITMLLGSIFTLVLLVAYIFVNNSLNRGDSTQLAAAVSALGSVSQAFPNIAFMCRFMFEGDPFGLILSTLITVAMPALALLAVKLFYLSTALAMQSTGSKKGAVSKEALGKREKSGTVKALTSYEAKSTRRNPAYLLYGFAMTMIWPVMMFLPILFGNNSEISEVNFPLNTALAQFCAVPLGVTASCFACGFNVLPATAFSREGGSFYALKALPIDFKDYCKSKRNFSMFVCSLGSVAYILILGIVCLITGVVEITGAWIFLYSAGVSFLTNLILVNCMLLKNAKKPNFDWDSETEISRKLSWINIAALIAGVVMFIALIVTAALATFTRADQIAFDVNILTLAGVIVCVVFGLILFAVAYAVNKTAVEKAERLLASRE